MSRSLLSAILKTFLRALMSLSAHGEKASIFYLQSPRATELNIETREAFIVYIANISHRDSVFIDFSDSTT